MWIEIKIKRSLGVEKFRKFIILSFLLFCNIHTGNNFHCFSLPSYFDFEFCIYFVRLRYEPNLSLFEFELSLLFSYCFVGFV